MKINNNHTSLLLRIAVAFLFLLSAVAKLYPSPYFAISTFEVKQLYPMGLSENVAAYFSRILIGVEFALGILLLQKHYLKKIVIPATLLMLIVFTTHLSIISFISGGNSGNCGCFGSLLPMTPIEAIVKNIIAIIALGVLYKLLPKIQTERHNFWILTTIIFGFILMIFMMAPIKSQTLNYSVSPIENHKNDSISNPVTEKVEKNNIAVESKSLPLIKSNLKDKEIVVPKINSGYKKYFSYIDNGKQILCFFVPGCEHCRATAKELTEMKKADPNFPKISILFMDEEANLIPDFFKQAEADYPYKIIDIIGFWKVLGINKDVPGIKLLENGKEIKYYFGTKEDKFNSTEFKKLLL